MRTTSNKRQLASGISVIAIGAALSFATPAYAQVEFGTIQGHVDGAGAGTQVVAVDTQTGQRGTGRVNAQGNYEIYNLRPSTYTVTVAGKNPQTTTVQVGQTTNVDFVQTRNAAGSIVVTGRRSAQPVQGQTVAQNITPAQIENLPQNARNFLSFATLAPGVQLTNPSGAVQFQAGALNADRSNVLLDGMSFKNPINHGGFFGQNFGDFGNPFPQIAIQEYQVETQNFGAEVGQSAAALLTAITKTGGNQFHGSAFIDYQPSSFVETPRFGSKNGSRRYQFGGDFGGPIIPGKLTFYVAAEGTSEKRPPATFNVTASVPQNLAALVNTPIPLTEKEGLYFGKLSFFADPENTFNAMAYIRRQANVADFGGNAVEAHGHLISTHETRFQLQWKHSAGEFLNFLNMSYNKSTNGTPNITNGPEYVLTGGTDTGSRLVLLGGNAFQQNDIEKSWVIKDDATLRRGEHTFKVGGQITFFDLARTEANEFAGTYFVSNPCATPPGTTCPITNFDITTATPFAATINLVPSPTIKGKDTQIGLYIQDEWKPDIHWTVNAGIRWDYESNANNNNYVTPPAIAAALRSYQGWMARGINAEDYISNGNNRHPYWKEFQPRLGVAYDLHGDRDTVIFGGAGRYYDRPLFIEGVIESLQNSNVTITQNLPACAGASPPSYCHDPNALRTYFASLGFTGGSVWVLPNKVKMPYSDQVDLGVRKRFGDINATLTYSHVESHNIFLFERANFFSNGWMTRNLVRDGAGNVIGCTNGGDQWIQDFIPPNNYPACPAMNGQLTGFAGKLNRGANNGRARLDALYLQVEKPFTDLSTWGFTESFTLQRARTNVGQDTINTDEMFNGPNLNTYGWNYVPNVPKWQSVTSVNWRAPWGITASGVLTLSSGPAFGHLVAPWTGGQPAPDGACCGPANLAGVFFPHTTFGYKRLDLRVAKTFKMPWGHGHEATIDFQAFNVFNWLNRTYSAWGAGGGNPPPLVENGQAFNDQRQFQVGLKYKF